MNIADHSVIDAAFDRANNRIITVSTSPNRLNILDPEARSAHCTHSSF